MEKIGNWLNNMLLQEIVHKLDLMHKNFLWNNKKIEKQVNNINTYIENDEL